MKKSDSSNGMERVSSRKALVGLILLILGAALIVLQAVLILVSLKSGSSINFIQKSEAAVNYFKFIGTWLVNLKYYLPAVIGLILLIVGAVNLRRGKAELVSRQINHAELSLNDDRRVRVLSPGAMVAKRFFRNRLAVTGLSVLVLMFVFSFLGGLLTPYGETQRFFRMEPIKKEYCAFTVNDQLMLISLDETANKSYADAILASKSEEMKNTHETQYVYKDHTFTLTEDGEDFYTITLNGNVIGALHKDFVSAPDGSSSFSPEFQYASLKAFVTDEKEFTADGETYRIDSQSVMKNGEEIAFISRLSVGSRNDIKFSKRFRMELNEAVEKNENVFVFTDEDGTEAEYQLVFSASKNMWSVMQRTTSRQYDMYSAPSNEHPLGTDDRGMDMITRLMYGGRVSLIIGFIVVFIEAGLGIIFGGISGYFGGWIDNLIMRIVDIFYCIPSTPILIIIGATMDAQNVDSKIRMMYLMLLLGFLGWPGIARLVRGQILSLREQEFMTAAEAGGVRVSRRIFKHLIPNVIPQLIVTCTMGLGSTIIMEATLSFLGLGVRFPFASWGNIMSAIESNSNNVLTLYPWVWIPAGLCLLATVLAFNLVGDGLRDAFDPKMKR